MQARLNPLPQDPIACRSRPVEWTDMNGMEQTLELSCQGYTNKVFAPILESDVVAYLYHLHVCHFRRADSIHLDTRVCQRLNSRSDFVVGNVNYCAKRPCIEKPELVAEVKAFPIGFTARAHATRMSRSFGERY